MTLVDIEGIIKTQEKLSYSDAKELYIKASKEQDNNKRKELLNEIVIGTLYYPLEYLKNNDINIFNNPSFDDDDLVNSFCEEWTKAIHDGLLLKRSFSQIIDQTYINKIFKNTYGEAETEIDSYITNVFFERLLWEYLKVRESGKEITIDELLENHKKDYNLGEADKSLFDEDNEYGRSIVYKYLQNIYNFLKRNEDGVINTNPNKIHKYIKFYMKTGLENKIKNNNFKVTFEDRLVKDKNTKKFLEQKMEIKLTELEKSIISDRFGLNGNSAMNLDDTAKKYNMSRDKIRIIEERIFKKLKAPHLIDEIPSYTLYDNIELDKKIYIEYLSLLSIYEHDKKYKHLIVQYFNNKYGLSEKELNNIINKYENQIENDENIQRIIDSRKPFYINNNQNKKAV